MFIFNIKNHIKIGIFFSLFFINIGKEFDLLSAIIIVFGSGIGSVIPDLDHPKSKLNQLILEINQKYFKIIVFSAIGIVFYIYGGLSGFFIGGYFILAGFSGHRGFTHSLLGLLWFSLICKTLILNFHISEANLLKEALSIKELFSVSNEIGYNFAKGLMAGYISHIISDFLTPRGIKLLWPQSKNYKIKI